MDKIIELGKVRAGDQILLRGDLLVVSSVRHHRGTTKIEVEGDAVELLDELVAIRRPVRPRSRPGRPPLTAALNPEDRQWTEDTSALLGISPQELLALALYMYRRGRETDQARKPRRWGRRRHLDGRH